MSFSKTIWNGKLSILTLKQLNLNSHLKTLVSLIIGSREIVVQLNKFCTELGKTQLWDRTNQNYNKYYRSDKDIPKQSAILSTCRDRPRQGTPCHVSLVTRSRALQSEKIVGLNVNILGYKGLGEIPCSYLLNCTRHNVLYFIGEIITWTVT